MRLTRLGSFAACAIVFASGCASDSAVGPKNQSAELNALLGEMSLSSIVPPDISVRGTSPLLNGAVVPSDCTFDGSASFVCKPVVSNGYTINTSYTLLTSDNRPQSAFDAATTAAVRTATTIVGSTTFNGETSHIDAQQSMTLSGLLTGNHVLDGTQVMHMTSTLLGKTFTATGTTTVAGLVLAPAGSATKYPRAGTITMAFTEDAGSSLGTSGFTTVMVFNGTSKVAVTYSASGMPTEHCTYDLAVPGPGAFSCSSTTP